MRAGVRRRWRALALAVGLLLTAGAIAAPSAARADDPTWAQVQQAKRSARAKAQEVAAIQRVLGGLEDEAARLGTVALQKAAQSEAARTRLEAAQAQLDRLRAQADAAERRAASARRTAGAVATQLYRSGDPGLSLWLAGRGTGSLLYRLGALARIGTASTSMLQQATEEQRDAQAIGALAKAQTAVRNRLADQAQEAANTAKQAEEAAQAQVRATAKRRATLTAQLRSLQATSSALQASYAAAQAAKRAAAAGGAGGGGGGSLAGLAPGPDSLSPGGAQSYAAGRLGAYGWGGGQMGCLVRLWNIESGWRWNAYNASSGAYGIPQSLPGGKMAAEGGDWTTSSKTQIEWGLGYIKARYATPCGALSFETSHSPYWY